MLNRIEVEEDHVDHLETLRESHDAARVAFQESAILVKRTSDNFWDAIRVLYPEVPKDGKISFQLNDNNELKSISWIDGL